MIASHITMAVVLAASLPGCATEIAVRSSRSAAAAEDSAGVNRERTPLSMTATYIGEAATNSRGGLREAATFVGRLLIAVDLTLDDRQGQGGRSIRAIVTNRHGTDLGSVAI